MTRFLPTPKLSKNFWLHGSDDLSNSSLTTHHSQLFCHFVPHAVQGFICEIDNHEQRAETRQLWNVPPASSLVLTLPLPTATANCPQPAATTPPSARCNSELFTMLPAIGALFDGVFLTLAKFPVYRAISSNHHPGIAQIA